MLKKKNINQQVDNVLYENDSEKPPAVSVVEDPSAKKKNNFREVLFKVAISKWFNHFINFAIVFNTAILALDRHPRNIKEQQIFENTNIVFTVIFVIEMIIKMIGLGPKGYVRDKFNIFD